AGLERRVRQERLERRHRLTGARIGGRRQAADALVGLDDFGAGKVELRLAGLAAIDAAGASAALVDRQRDGVPAEAFLGDERLGGVDELLEVLEPLLAVALVLVEVDQARRLEHVDDDLAQRQAARRRAHRVDPRRERRQVGAALAGDRADALPEALSARARSVLQLLDRARTDAARREVDDAQEAGVVV